MKNKIALASDHAGYNLKNEILNLLKEKYSDLFEFSDLGCECSNISVNYPEYAKKVADFVQMSKHNLGILICGTGIGMSMSANKFKGIRSALLSDSFSAKMARKHNNANIICLGSRVIGIGLAKDIVCSWLDSSFEGGRHQERLDIIRNLEGEK